MSKITKALEKAARERIQKLQEQPTVKAPAIEVAVQTSSRLGQISSAGRIHIDPHIVGATDPKSPIAEQYRILRTNLQSLKLRQGSSKVIVVTSAVHGEGKSVTTINLALTFARQENLKVVLVDADMRKSSIQRWLGLAESSHGLSTVLQHGGELNGSLIRLEDPPLAVLPAGPHPENPAELLESSAMKRLLATLKQEFDIILLDTPPVLPVADPGIAAAHADGVLMVVRAGKTQRKTVTQAQQLLTQMKANLLGSILTHVEYYLPGYYRYYHYYRYGSSSKESNGKSEGTKAGSPVSGQQPSVRS
jgi:capsular exopolysaccharide synthesis family protein